MKEKSGKKVSKMEEEAVMEVEAMTSAETEVTADVAEEAVVKEAEEKKAAKKESKSKTTKSTTKTAAAKSSRSQEKEEKETPKKTTRKSTAKKEEVIANVTLQFDGKAYTELELRTIAKDVWKYDLQKDESEITSIELYVKPLEGVCYYVFNGEITGSFRV